MALPVLADMSSMYLPLLARDLESVCCDLFSSGMSDPLRGMLRRCKCRTCNQRLSVSPEFQVKELVSMSVKTNAIGTSEKLLTSIIKQNWRQESIGVHVQNIQIFLIADGEPI